MSMYKILSVSNRRLCRVDFLQRLSEISKKGIPVILREKDLTEEDYMELLRKAAEICPDITAHNFIAPAKKLGVKKIHLPMNILKAADISGFQMVGASVHSPEEAYEAQTLGASYVTAGHVFETDCKKGLEPRGLDFLESVCRSVDIPVYAIGGINASNAGSAVERGAIGVCIMSGLMTCENVWEYLSKYY